ncbi:MAG: HIT family protein [Acidimicrobiales bacterium]
MTYSTLPTPPSEQAADCYACRQAAAGESAERRERIFVTDQWRLVHSFNSSLEGWLVLLPRRHVTAIVELQEAEAGELGPLLLRSSQALRAELGCAKTYVMQFSEAEGYAHLHFHVVARPAELPAEHRGPGIFHYLRQPPEDWVSAERQDQLAVSIRRRMSA